MESQRSWSSDRIKDLENWGLSSADAQRLVRLNILLQHTFTASHQRDRGPRLALAKSTSAAAITKDDVLEESSLLPIGVPVFPCPSPDSTLHSPPTGIHSRGASVESGPYVSAADLIPLPPMSGQHRQLGSVNEAVAHLDASASAQSLNSQNITESRSQPPSMQQGIFGAASQHHVSRSHVISGPMAHEMPQTSSSTVRTIMPSDNDLVGMHLGKVNPHHFPGRQVMSSDRAAGGDPVRSIMTEGNIIERRTMLHSTSSSLQQQQQQQIGSSSGQQVVSALTRGVRASSTFHHVSAAPSGVGGGIFRAQTSGLPSGSIIESDSSSDDCEEATKRLLAGMTAAAEVRMSHHDRFERRSEPFDHRPAEPSMRRTPTGDMEPSNLSHTSSLNLTSEEAEALERRRRSRSNYHLTSGQAAVELFLRLNHARQTLDFTKRQASMFSNLDHAEMDVWEALDTLNELREYETALMAAPASSLDPDMPLRDHALQTAELCRLAHPDKDWLHLVGLVHGLGKLLAHSKFGSQPQWATCGESYPLGCRFDSNIQGGQFFTANPDRRRRMYQTPLGIYQKGCGLQNVFMSWSASEYLYLMMLLNDTELPKEALFIIRYQKFFALTRSGTSAYRPLMNEEDEALLPLLASFQKLSRYRRIAIPESQAFTPEQQKVYYDRLIVKYLGNKKLSW